MPIVNEIKVQTAAILLERDQLPPVITSSSVVGAARSAELFDGAYAEHARRIARLAFSDRQSPDEAT